MEDLDKARNAGQFGDGVATTAKDSAGGRSQGAANLLVIVE